MDSIKEIKKCQLCGNKEFAAYLDFGLSPLANSLKETENQQEFLSPLEVVKCGNLKCEGFQLKYLVNPEILFSNYNYRSSNGLDKHFQEYARYTYKLLGLKKDDLMIGIGGNIGQLEKAYNDLGLIAINCEPAQNIAFESRQNGVQTINSFFSSNILKDVEIINKTFNGIIKSPKAKLICANNVMAHCNLGPIIEGIKNLLDKDGIFIMENAYWLDSVKNSDVFQIYSEHYKYLSIKPLVNFFNLQGFDVFRVEYNQIQCGSFRAYIKFKKNKNFEIDKSVQEAVNNEEQFGLYKKETYDKLLIKLDILKIKIKEILKEVKDKNGTIGLFGVAAKTVLMLKYLNIGEYIDFATDDSTLKHNKFVPGQKIKIVDKNTFWSERFDLVIPIYNFFNQIVKNNQDKKTKWLRVLPIVELHEN